MPGPQGIRSAMQSYVKFLTGTDIDGIMGLFADDATVEDSVGSEVLTGRDALGAFYGVADSRAAP
jgi:steroid delta-isomerase